MFSMLGAWWDIFSYIGELLGGVFVGILFLPFTLIFQGILIIVDFAEETFKKLAGLDTMFLNGSPINGTDGSGQDLVYAFISDSAIQDIFWSIVALSVVLLFVLTIVAMIRSEFTIDLKGAAKMPIITRALKSLVNFIMVPAVSIFGIFAVNFLNKSMYDMFGGDTTTIVQKVFYVATYNANRARNDSKFATALSSNEYGGGFKVFDAGSNPFSGMSGEGLATTIDNYFSECENISGLSYNSIGVMDKCEVGNADGYVNWTTLIFGYPGSTKFSIINPSAMNFYYDLLAVDWIMGIGTGIVIGWLLLSVCLVLVKRVFEITILFLLSPAMVAIAPLDGGQAEKKWRSEFIKRLLAVIGPIFAYNTYFLMMPLFENISLFSISATAMTATTPMLGAIQDAFASLTFMFDVFFQLICIIVGLGIIKSASALLSSLLGVDDLVKAGGEAAKKAVDVGKKAALGATAIGGVAIKGAAAVAKGGLGVAKALKNKAAVGVQKAKAFGQRHKKGGTKDQVEDADKKLAEHDKSIDSKDKEIADKQKEMMEAEGSTYADDTKRMQELRAMGDGRTTAETAEMDALGEKIKQAEKDSGLTGLQDDKKTMLKNRESLQQTADDAKKADDFRKKGFTAAAQTKYENLSAGKNADGTETTDEKEIAKNKKKAARMEKRRDGSSILKNVYRAYDSEFGEEADKTSLMAKVTGGVNKFAGKYLSNVPFLNKIPDLTNSLNELFATKGSVQKRRLNDALAGLFGDGGGGDLYKMWFNKNARAALYEGVPEAKARTALIEAKNSWGAKDKYDAEKKAKEDKKKEMEVLRRFYAEQSAEFRKMRYDREQAQANGDEDKVKKLDVEMANFQMSAEIEKKAEAGYKKGAFNNADVQKVKDQITAEGKKDAAFQNAKDAKEAEAYRRMADQALGGGNSKNPQKTQTDFSNDTLDKLQKAIMQAMKKGSEDIGTAIAAKLKEEQGQGKDSDVVAVLQEILKLLQ